MPSNANCAHLYEREFTFQPSHKLIIATNHKPELEVDNAARRSVHLVPFDAEFTGTKEDKGLETGSRKKRPESWPYSWKRAWNSNALD